MVILLRLYSFEQCLDPVFWSSVKTLNFATFKEFLIHVGVHHTHALLIINEANLSSLAHILLVVKAKGAGAATVPLIVTHHALLLWAVASNLLNLLQF